MTEGFAISRDLADEVILTAPAAVEDRHWRHAALLINGSVLDPGEGYASDRLLEAAGPAYVTGLHAMSEWVPELRKPSRAVLNGSSVWTLTELPTSATSPSMRVTW
jgi:hypothetical protein